MNYDSLANIVRKGLGLDSQESPFAFAQRLYFELVPCRAVTNGAEIIERSICWDAFASRDDQRFAVGREICRWLLETLGEDASDESALALRVAMFSCAPARSASRGKPILYALRPLNQAARTGYAVPQAPVRRHPALGARRR